MLIIVPIHDMLFYLSFLNNYEFLKVCNLFLDCVVFLKIIIISNHNQFLFLKFYFLISYNFINTSCTLYPFICDKRFLNT